MSIEVVTQFRAKPGRSAELLGLVLNLMPAEQRPEGCLEFSVRRNQDDASDIIAEQRWQSRQQAERWRANPHTLTAIRAIVAEPLQVRCFETVEAASATSPRPDLVGALPAVETREIPKVSTPDALGG